LVLGLAMTPFRDTVPQEQTVLVLTFAVVLGAMIGGRVGGAAAAVMAAVTYDFFFVLPYLSLRISSETDIASAGVLLAVGLVVGQLTVFAHNRSEEAALTRTELGSLFRVSRLAAAEPSSRDVELSVCSELLGLLTLAECRFVETSALDRPVLGPSGALVGSGRRFAANHEYTLPDEGVAIAVDGAGTRFGYLLCTPIPDTGVSLERRRVAVALADQLGLSLAAGQRPTHPSQLG
jgi:hypothetical protein